MKVPMHRFPASARLLPAGALLLLAQCYFMRGNSGGADLAEPAARRFTPGEIAVPAGYRAELVASGLTFPTGVAFDARGVPYVVESGYCYGETWTRPRLLRVTDRGIEQVAAGEPDRGPWTGVACDGTQFYVAEGSVLHGGRILRIDGDGAITVLAQDLPSFGDHHVNGPSIGPDGALYFGIGTATNSGVVGEDNARFGWLERRPEFRDIPGQDIRLADVEFETPHPLDPERGLVRTGAFATFGTTAPGRSVAGRVPCTGGVMKLPAGGGPIELVAWGFRNPFGLAFAADGRLFVTDNGYDDRGSRPVWGAGDLLWVVQPGVWYGWPDFSGDRPLTDDEFDAGVELRFVLAEHPNRPPKPAAILPVHAAAGGLDFSRSDTFGHRGDAFVALFGDQTPATGDLLAPVGFQVVRVETGTGIVHEFAANRGDEVAPGSHEDGGGFERPVAVRFDPSGESLYVVDFGILTETDEGSRPVERSGCLWRIRRGGGDAR
jgi:glucose/arabinose dehydrogenase